MTRQEPTINRPGAAGRWVPLGLAGLGGGIAAFGLLADLLGIGQDPGFGANQALLAVSGLALLGVGLGLATAAGRGLARRLVRSRIVLAGAGLVLGLFLVEAGLRTLQWIWFAEEGRGLASLVPDPTLGVRLAPHVGGHDARGFRNARVPDRAAIVAIGDSQTYGVGAQRSQAWPQALARRAGREVYNMGLGSYGPVQYWKLAEEALALDPQVILIGLYLGNDLYDAYQMAYQTPAYPDLRAPEDAAILARDTVGPVAQAYQDQRLGFHQARSRWAKHVTLLQLLQRHRLWPSAVSFAEARAWVRAYPDRGLVATAGPVRTVCTPAIRLLALDLEEPRIAEGLRITETALARTRETLAGGPRLLVLLIPTKETVFADAAHQGSEAVRETYARLLALEARVRRRLMEGCAARGIPCLDLGPALQEALARGEQVYAEDFDSHPAAGGYGVIAAVAQEALEGMDGVL